MSGAARPGDGLDQADIDMVMGPAAGAAPPAPASDPLAPLNALTPEEKIALFS
jgi:hypothetical protein